MITKGLTSSLSCEWTTPPELFKALDDEFHFTLDPCSTKENHLCNKFYTKAENGLLQSWQKESVYCNPPYGREIPEWVKKSFFESLYPDTKVVMLIPARTDTSYFHDYILPYAEIRFIRGRLKFGNSKDNAPFPSMIVIY